jgi:hypothetical protein
VSSEGKPHRLWIALAIVLGLIAAVALRTKVDDRQPAKERVAPVSVQAAMSSSGQNTNVAPFSSDGTGTTRPHIEPNVAGARAPAQPLSAASAGVSYEAGRPLDILLNAPIQAAHGSTFDVSVALPSGAPVHSAKFRVGFDAESLEVLGIVDQNGTFLAVVPAGDSTVELDYETGAVGREPPAIRFLARVDIPRVVQLTASARAWNDAGEELSIAPFAPYPIMLVR